MKLHELRAALDKLIEFDETNGEAAVKCLISNGVAGDLDGLQEMQFVSIYLAENSKSCLEVLFMASDYTSDFSNEAGLHEIDESDMDHSSHTLH